MVLFEQDIVDQRVTIDTTTNNISFIRLSMQLRSMGIKNNKFILALHDRDLRGIDPHNLNDPSIELRIRIMEECRNNYWYFIRECVKVPIHGSITPGPFEASRGNIAIAWSFFNDVDTFLTMIRQVGKTWATMSIAGYCIYIASSTSTIGLFAHRNSLVLENVDRLKAVRDSLPKYLVHSRSDDTDNKEGLSYAELNNEYKTFLPAPSPMLAGATARGESFIYSHFDELTSYRFNKLAYPAAMSATDTAQAIARANGLHCANLITTTAGRLNEPSGQFAYSIKCKCLRFSEKFYDLPSRKALGDLLKESENGMMYMEFNHLQMGKSNEWLEEKRKASTDPIQFLTDYCNEWVSATGNPVFGVDILRALTHNKREPISTSIIENMRIKWYVDEATFDKNVPIIIGNDTSDNAGRDFTTLVGVDPRNMKTVFTTRCNTTNLLYVTQCIANLMIRVFPNSVFIPERNKNGQFLIDALLTALVNADTKIDPFKRIFNMLVQDMEDNAEYREMLRDVNPENGTIRTKFGFYTGTKTRATLFNSVLSAAVTRCTDRIYDMDIIDQIKSLVIRKGRIDHPEGGHDDDLVAWLLCAWLLIYGKNLHYYGLMPSNVLSEVTATGDSIDPMEKERQLAFVHRINELSSLVKDESIHPQVRRHYEIEMKHLQSQVKKEFLKEDVMSVTQLVESNKQLSSRPSLFSSASNITRYLCAV